MSQSCHNSDLESILTEISPHEVSWDQHRSDAESVKISITTLSNFQNMLTVLTAAQAFWNLGLILIRENWFSSKHFFAVSVIALCVSGEDLYFGGRLCFSNCQIFRNAFPTHRWVFLTLTVKKSTCYRTSWHSEAHERFMAAINSNQAV